MTLGAPEPLSERHDLTEFNCGIASLDEWLRSRALTNQVSGASRTFVITNDEHVVGYYALASSSINNAEAVGRFRRNMPDPVPVVMLGRLAIDREHQAVGLGRALLRDAAKRVIAAADLVGVRGMIVQAINADAKAFYHAFGFEPSPTSEMTLMISLTDLQKSL